MYPVTETMIAGNLAAVFDNIGGEFRRNESTTEADCFPMCSARG